MGVLTNDFGGPLCEVGGGLLPEYITEAVFLHDGSTILYMNPSARRLLGIEKNGDWAEKNMSEFLCVTGKEAGEGIGLEALRPDRDWKEGRLTNVRGESFPVEIVTQQIDKKDTLLELVLCRELSGRNLSDAQPQPDSKAQIYESLIIHNPAVIITMDTEGMIVGVNPAAEQLFDVSASRWVRERFLDWVNRDDADFVRSAMQLTLSGLTQAGEFSCRNDAGGRIDMGGKFVPILVDGVAVGMYFVGKDITSRKLAERELRHTRELLESFVSHTSDAFVVLDRHGIVQQCNNAFETMFGWPFSEVIGSPIPFIADAQSPFIRSQLRRLFKTGEPASYEFRAVHRNGTILDISITVSPIKNAREDVIALAGIARDITEQKRMEEALRESEAKYRLIADNMTDLIVILNRSFTIDYVSPSHMAVLGLEEKELLKQSFPQLVHKDDRKPLDSKLRKMLKSKCPEHFEMRMEGPKGRLVLESSWIPVFDESGRVHNIILVARDITSRKRIELALREAEEKYRSLVEEAIVGVYLIQSSKLTYVNPRLAEMIGYTPSELEGREFASLIHEEDREILDTLRLTLKKGSIHHTLRALHKDGRTIEVEVHGTKTEFQEQSATIGTVLDVTERKKTDELLRKSDKLSVVGQMAAGVAHEIRNPLTSLKGFVQLLKARHTSDRQYLDIMLSELERINYIVSEFMVIAKPQVVQFQQRNAAKILRDVIPILDTQAIMNNVQIVTDLDARALSLYGDENQLKQVFINILKNAIEAMPHGGTVTIRARRTAGGKILVRFKDQGTGIPEDRMPQIGEPFYTTKEKGTGLGLMVCYKIIEMHGGTIQIQSKWNGGTTVDILLPAIGDADTLPEQPVS